MPKIYRHKKLVAVSKSTKKALIELGFKYENIEIIYNGVELDLHEDIKKSSYPSFIYLGRIKKYKRIEKALDIFMAIKNIEPLAKFYIVGSGDHLHAIKDRVAKLGLNKAVFFTGFVSEEVKIMMLQEAWFMIQPSEMEGWGLTVIEATRCSTPSIIFDAPGLRDAVINNETGFILDPDNINVGIIFQNIMNPFKRILMRQKCVAHSKNFSWDSSAKEFERLLAIDKSSNKFYRLKEY